MLFVVHGIFCCDGCVSAAEGVGAFLVETGFLHTEDERLAVGAEAVLLNFEESFTVRLGVLLFVDEEVAVGVDGVFDLLFACEVAAFGDLADDERDAVGFLAPVGDHLNGANLGHGVGVAVLVLAVVQRLERVEDDEDLFVGVSLAKGVCMGEDVLYHVVLSCDEAVFHVEAFGDLADLEERFLAGVEEAEVAGRHDRFRELEAHGGLACAGGAGEHHGS